MKIIPDDNVWHNISVSSAFRSFTCMHRLVETWFPVESVVETMYGYTSDNVPALSAHSF